MILCEKLTKKGAEKLEAWFIEYYDSMNPEKGYNRITGGARKGSRASKALREKISQAKIHTCLTNSNYNQWNKEHMIEHYRRQLHIYAFLVEQRTGQRVSKMHLYYTGEESGNPMISFPYTKSAIEGTVSAFDDTVHKIMKKDFSRQAESLKTCNDCDFRFYCQNK